MSGTQTFRLLRARDLDGLGGDILRGPNSSSVDFNGVEFSIDDFNVVE